MLTLFAVPKPFEGHIRVIQNNAIRSWARLPAVDIVLLGNEAGTAEVAAEIRCVHIPDVERNEFGTPLLPSCFTLAAGEARGELMAYVNADIVLMSDFIKGVERVAGQHRAFLMAGQRTDLDVRDPLEFGEGWEADLRGRVQREGRLLGPDGIDYFVFRKGLWPEMPPFAIGRWVWDNWLLYDAVARGATLIDATPSILAIHQSHGYEHHGATGRKRQDGPEARANLALHPDWVRWFNVNHASRLLYPSGLRRAWDREHLSQRLMTWLLLRHLVRAFLRASKRVFSRLHSRFGSTE